MFLSCREMWDRPLGNKGFGKQIPHWAGNVIYAVVGTVLKIAFRYKIEGLDNFRLLANKSGAVLVSNHSSYLDVAFLYVAARSKQWIRFIGKSDLFDKAHGLLGQILSRTGAIPLERDSADRIALKRAASMLKRNEYVGIMPEGTRRAKGDKVPKIHGGAALIARMGNNAPIIPTAVCNVDKIKQPGKLIRFPKVTVKFGDPIFLEDFDFIERSQRLEACTWYAMRQCFALFDGLDQEQVDMTMLFPDGIDYTDIFVNHPIAHHTYHEVLDRMQKFDESKEE